MTPENLERHIKLQPLYRKMMGEIQEYEYVYQDGKLGRVLFMWNDDTPTTKMFTPEDEYNPTGLLDTAVRIPLPIDPVNPKRGLWGMVDWSKLRYEQWGPDGEIAIFKLPFIHLNKEMDLPIKDHPFIVDDPEPALIKALCEQEGV